MKVWDGYIRFFHWALVSCLVGLYFSAEEGAMELHFVLGYITLALLATRLIWGLVGSDTARISALLHGPKAVAQALKAKHLTPGHNAAGSYMVLVFFALILLQLVTGLMATDDIMVDGPLVQYVSYEWVEWASSLHHQNFDWLLIAIGLHLLAIIVYALRGKKLVPAMITGRNQQLKNAVRLKASWPAFAIFAVLLGMLLATWGYEPLQALL
ncbi:cytochrome b/b6 domain-containing protein [Pseudoalteromonas sp. T1lg48]|uniref:cytochrome b/b6 domain-containing protein n=1 Tax=Pseudoalteromonas sp. T1lg48 TaxID=2077100 RepID=UPI000CF5F348|nr:cytochrome b/b6 domain-containing protein [Pseudoalteromonas sp. T1lg48]